VSIDKDLKNKTIENIETKPHTEADVLPVYKEKSRYHYYNESIPNPNILFYTAGTGMRVDTVQFYKMLVRKDAQFRTVINVRKLAVISCDWDIIPYSKTEEAIEYADFVKDIFENRIPSMRACLNQMMDAIVTGYTVHEVLTKLDEHGNETVKELVYRNPDRFEFGIDGKFYLVDSVNLRRRELDTKHFLIHRNDANPENPYGESVLGEASFWLYYLKSGNWKDWAQFNERFGQGILKGEYERGDIRAMNQTFDALKQLRSNGYAVFEKGSNVDIIEASRRTGDYKDLLNEIDRAIAKMVLGQELTTSTGSGSGSYALGKVHQNTFDNIVMSDRANLEESINDLIRNILRRTFPGLNKFPKFKFKVKTANEE
jgi:phage gp29-like protein